MQPQRHPAHLLQARHALTSESKCHWSYKTPGFNNLQFYEQIIGTVKSWKEEEQQSLLQWWNRCETSCFPSGSSFPAPLLTSRHSMVLSQLHGGAHTTSLGDAPVPGSGVAVMLQQAAGTGAAPR